jgi:hypothetical protein
MAAASYSSSALTALNFMNRKLPSDVLVFSRVVPKDSEAGRDWWLTSIKLWSISSSITPGAGLSEDEDAVTLAGSSNLLMIERVALGSFP